MKRTVTELIQRYSHINWALADQAMVSGANFLTGILLARYLGIEEFGRFTLVWMAVIFVNSIQHAMINSPMMSLGPKRPEAEASPYYGAIIVQMVVFAFFTSFLLLMGVWLSGVLFPEWQVEGLALPLATAALAFQFQDFLRRYFFTRGRAAAAFVNDAIRYMGQIAVLTWLFMSFHEHISTARVLWLIAIMAAVATTFGAFLVERIEVNPKILRTTVSRHWHFSKWMTGSALMQWTTGNLFFIMAGVLLGASAVGALRAAQNLINVINILFMGLENILPARAASHFHVGGIKALRSYLKQVTLLGGVATFIMTFVAAIAPDFWLGLFFGDQYIGYGHLLQWWALIYVLIFFGLPLMGGLRALEQPQTIFNSYLWMTLFSVLAAYPMTLYLGLNGVLGGIALFHFFQLLILWFGLKKRLI
jgi:O-antigen/teichoic acid export membrane protein